MLPKQGRQLLMKAALKTHTDSEHFHMVCNWIRKTECAGGQKCKWI